MSSSYVCIHMGMNAVLMCVYVQWKESGTIYIYQAALAAIEVERRVRKCMLVKICLVVHYNGQGYIQYVHT